MNDQDTATAREDTMLYRKPTPDSDDNAVSEIWGQPLETRVVDASEVPDLLAEGWVGHPMEIDGGRKQKPEEAAGFVPVKGAKDEALEAAEKLVAELTRERDVLQGDVNLLTTERDLRKEEIATLTADNAKLAEDLKAAEQLTAEETKAKDAALAEIEQMKAAAAAKPPLKPKGT